MVEQQILKLDTDYKALDRYLMEGGHSNILLVCGNSIKNFKLGAYFEKLEERLPIRVIRFCDFNPNPDYESVVKGVELLNREACTLIVAVGGGSAMDVAKCIKLYSNMEHSKNYLQQVIVPNDITLLAVPTTAGTGSEATRFAVIYYKGEKQSVADDSCIPSTVIFEPSFLKTLPDYQRKSTMLDALCHAIESYWSVHSTEESRRNAKAAIQTIFYYKDAYLSNDDLGNAGMLQAANLAGKAINITQTTAGHAMCYKLTGLYHISHGHAAALCISQLLPYMIAHTEKCIDSRGAAYLQGIFVEIAEAMGGTCAIDAASIFSKLLTSLELEVPTAEEQDFVKLKNSVNPIRLKNNPIELDVETIDWLYHQILRR